MFCLLAYPLRARAVVSISGSVVLTALAAYLAASGITYAATGGTSDDILQSLQDQITPWAQQTYGSFQGFLDVVSSIKSPFGSYFGKLMIGSAIIPIFSSARSWLIQNFFADSDSIVVDSRLIGSDVGFYSVSGAVTGTYRIISSDAGSTYQTSYSSGELILIDRYAIGSAKIYPSCIDGYIDISNNNLRIVYNKNGYASASNIGTYRYIYLGFSPTFDSRYVLCYYYTRQNDSVADDQLLQLGRFTFSVSGGYEGMWLGGYTSSPYELTSTYDDSVTVPQVEAGQALVIDDDTALISTLDDLLAVILQGIEEGQGELDSEVVDQPVTVNPPAYVDPSQYSIGLTSFFPFCIPFDIVQGISLLAASPVAPSLSWAIPLPSGDVYTLDLDFAVFDDVAEILRRMELLVFGIGLAFVTSRLIKW